MPCVETVSRERIFPFATIRRSREQGRATLIALQARQRRAAGRVPPGPGRRSISVDTRAWWWRLAQNLWQSETKDACVVARMPKTPPTRTSQTSVTFERPLFAASLRFCIQPAWSGRTASEVEFRFSLW